MWWKITQTIVILSTVRSSIDTGHTESVNQLPSACTSSKKPPADYYDIVLHVVEDDPSSSVQAIKQRIDITNLRYIVYYQDSNITGTTCNVYRACWQWSRILRPGMEVKQKNGYMKLAQLANRKSTWILNIGHNNTSLLTGTSNWLIWVARNIEWGDLFGFFTKSISKFFRLLVLTEKCVWKKNC